MLVAVFGFACGKFSQMPTEFPTPELPPRATPAAKLELKPDVELEKQIAKIAEAAKGKVGVAAVVLETGESASLNADQHFPMQSVYKLPIAMAVMEKVRLGELDLDEQIGVSKEDMVREGQASPLRDKNPNGGEFTIRELIRLSLKESDGTASDVLMRVVGGGGEVQSYLDQIGVRDMKVLNTEKEIGRDWQMQYENWSTPIAATDVLRYLCAASSGPASQFNCLEVMPIDNLSVFQDVMKGLLFDMSRSNPGPKRLKGLLPAGTIVAHKTGTGGTQNGITAATNDIGIIYLSNGKHIAIAIFVSDSPANEETREAVIAKIAKACWDKWEKK